jgi:hypothetical protein
MPEFLDRKRIYILHRLALKGILYVTIFDHLSQIGIE